MSELIDNTNRKRSLLKHMMLQLHNGEAPEAVRSQLTRMLQEVPYDMVVEVEQELLADGMPAEEILKFCDVHAEVLRGNITHTSHEVPTGHPVHTFKEENKALQWEISSLRALFNEVDTPSSSGELSDLVDQIHIKINALTDVEKHYQRKEHLLFPFLEKHNLTGPPKVMWGKHDQVRELLGAAVEALKELKKASREELSAMIPLLLEPTLEGLEDMIYREEQILFPLSLDTLEESEWFAIYTQSPSVGFCLYDPVADWKPDGLIDEADSSIEEDRVQLPSGSFTTTELTSILNSIPFDLTFVDSEDKVRFFTQGCERIFTRTRAILGRKVQLCHPPSSVHIVEQILHDFKSGKQNRAPFWINLKGKFIHIEYIALRDSAGRYFGTLEVSQDLTSKRALEGEQRLLAYTEEGNGL